MRQWKIIGAVAMLLGEVALQVSGYQNPALATALLVIMVGLLLWSAWPAIQRMRFQKPIKLVGGVGKHGLKTQQTTAEVAPDKLHVVVQAIKEAKGIQPLNPNGIAVYIKADNKLKTLYPEEVKSILLKLEEQGALKLVAFPDWMLPNQPATVEAVRKQIRAMLDRQNYFTVILTDKFGKASK